MAVVASATVVFILFLFHQVRVKGSSLVLILFVASFALLVVPTSACAGVNQQVSEVPKLEHPGIPTSNASNHASNQAPASHPIHHSTSDPKNSGNSLGNSSKSSTTASSNTGKIFLLAVEFIASFFNSQFFPLFGDGPRVKASLYLAGDHLTRVPGYEWCCDSGTNRFVTNNINDFVPGSYVKRPTDIAVGGGKVTSPGYGNILVQSLDYGCTTQCKRALLLPHCEMKLMPVTVFVRLGCSITMKDNEVHLLSREGSSIFSGKDIGGLYMYHSKTVSHKPSQQKSKPTALFGLPVGKKPNSQDFPQRLLETHWCYGHLHFSKLRKLLGLGKGDDPDCASCAIAKSRKIALSKTRENRSTRINHRIHLDIGFTRNSTYCFQLAVDDYTRYGFIEVFKNKSEAFDSFVLLHKQRNNEHCPYNLAVLKTDSEPLYTSQKFNTYCENNGIVQEFSARYRHDQHGVVERAMQAIGDSFRCSMIHGHAPENAAPDCLIYSNVFRNHTGTKANKGWSPREKEAGTKLPINKRLLLGPIFCLVFAHVYEEERDGKHAARGIPCGFHGYDPLNNQFKVRELQSGKEYYTFDLTWHPKKMVYRVVLNTHTLRTFNDLAPHVLARMELDPHPPVVNEPNEPILRKSNRVPQPSDQSIRNIGDVDVPPANFMVEGKQQSGVDFLNTEDVFVNFVHNFGPDPTSWPECMQSKYAIQWIEAREKEKNAFKHHNVLSFVLRSSTQGKKIFKPRPVYKIKVNPPSTQNPNASIEKFKYRLTIAAFKKMLTQGIDYQEKYASTVRWNSLKVIFAIACKCNYDIVLFDISSFFLYGVLKSEIYMEQCEGWEDPAYPKELYVCKLNKSMYGLPQSPYRAQVELKQALYANGEFKSTTADDCIFKGQEQETKYVALGAHVDDLPTTGVPAGIKKAEDAIGRKFKYTKIVNPDVITGVQIERNRGRGWLKLHQTEYTKQLLVDYGMQDCHGAETPLDPGTARAIMLLPVDEEVDNKVVAKYQKLVGELQWLRKTRSDIHFTLSLLSRFLKNATQRHLDFAQGRPLRFLKHTLGYGTVFYAGTGKWELTGASDADLAGDLTSARSTLGFYAKLGQFGIIISGCNLERKICTSTGQAETYALVSLIKSVIWLRNLLTDLGHPMEGPTALYVDNDGVKQQSTKVINHSTAKHYRISQAYIRQQVEDGVVTILRVSSERNPADMNTKALHALSFHRHQGATMGPQVPPD